MGSAGNGSGNSGEKPARKETKVDRTFLMEPAGDPGGTHRIPVVRRVSTTPGGWYQGLDWWQTYITIKHSGQNETVYH